MSQWVTERMKFNVIFEIWIFRYQSICFSTDCVRICVELKDIEVISTELSVRRAEITQVSVDVQHTCYVVPKF